MSLPTNELDASATAVLKRYAPGWAWLRENFKLPAILTLAGVFVAAGSWIWSQHAALERLEGREDPQPHLERIEAKLGTILEAQAAMHQQLADFGRRIDEQQRKWDRVEEVAESRIPRRHPR